MKQVKPAAWHPWITVAVLCGVLFCYSRDATGACSATWSTGGSNPNWTLFNTCGLVGIGTSSPAFSLHVYSPTKAMLAVTGVGTGSVDGSSIRFGNDGGDDRALIFLGGSGYLWAGGPNSLNIYQRLNAPLTFSTNAAERIRIDGAGKVGIGTSAPASALHVVGDLTLTGTGNISATGNIAAKYQDLAEWVPARGHLEAATVAILNPEQPNEVMASVQPYDTRVAGVISGKPGVVLGEAGAGKVMVATTGRVRVKVDASRGAIRIGDLLVTSNLEGCAMRSEPIEVAGVKIHRPGTLIGKALEPLESGQGEILVLLSLQ